MLLSDRPRRVYRTSLTHEVICQLRFPTILTINNNPPADFQESIRDIFPRYAVRQEKMPPQVLGLGGPNPQVKQQPPVSNYTFLSADGLWKLNLTQNFIALSTLRYTGWEEFARQLDRSLAQFISIYKPAYFERVGLRYLNFIDRKQLSVEDIPYRELIQPCYLGPLALEQMHEKSVSRCTIDTEFALRGGCRVKVHAGPAMVKQRNQAEGQQKFIFDMDLFMPGKIQVNLSAGALQTIHAQSYPLFRSAITDTLHDAMEPEFI